MLKLVKKLRFIQLFWFLFYFFVFGLLLRNSFNYLDADFGWHLKVGEEISKTALVPHLNNYNYTFTGNWVDHEWLSNLISFKIYDVFGYVGLSVFFALIIIASLLLLNELARRYYPKISPLFLAGVEIMGVIACLPHFGIRMQEFGLMFLLIELLIIESYSARRDVKKLFWLFPLMFFWACLHGSFLFGLAILFFWIAVKLFEYYLQRSKWGRYVSAPDKIGLSDIKKFAYVSLVAVAFTLFTPYGPELYSFLGGYTNSFYLLVIKEWQPQFNFPHNYWQLLYLAIVIGLLGLIGQDAWMKKSLRLNIWRLFLSLLLIYLSFSARRHFPLMFAGSFLFVLEAVYLLFEFDKMEIKIYYWWPRIFILICLFLGGAYQLMNIEFTNKPFEAYCHKYPCGAISYLQYNPGLLGLNLFNEYNWGGYMIWAYPEKKLFIDGRLPQVEYKGHSFVEEYLDFFQPSTNIKKKLADYDINLILLKTKDDELIVKKWEKFLFWIDENDFRGENYLRLYLQASDEWSPIYQDELATIYQKKR